MGPPFSLPLSFLKIFHARIRACNIHSTRSWNIKCTVKARRIIFACIIPPREEPPTASWPRPSHLLTRDIKGARKTGEFRNSSFRIQPLRIDIVIRKSVVRVFLVSFCLLEGDKEEEKCAQSREEKIFFFKLFFPRVEDPLKNWEGLFCKRWFNLRSRKVENYFEFYWELNVETIDKC